MNGIQVRQIDPYCNDMYNFRKEIICIDEHASENFLHTIIQYQINIPEEVWKFSKKKWDSIAFDGLFGVYYNGELAAISGSKLYGPRKEYVRVGMMYYVLKRFRKLVRSTLWSPGGMIDSALRYHKLTSEIEYSFVSIYPHNSKLLALCAVMSRRLGYGQLGNGKEHISCMKSFSVYNTQILFNGVYQHILYKAEHPNVSNIRLMINAIQDTY